MPNPANIPLTSLITQEANNQGVPPAIALAVAKQESGVSQWTSSGGLVTGTSGEVGVFQLMPATAAAYAPDGTGVDVNANIQGGISLLAALYAKYGNWAAALSAYNSGSPTGSPSYATSVLATAGSVGSLAATSVAPPDLSSVDSSIDPVDASSGLFSSPLVIGGIVLGAVALAWWVMD